MEIISTVAGTLLSMAIRSIDFSMPIEGTGEYKFNPKISQHDACRRAEERAKVQILEKTKGQMFSSEHSQQCIEDKNTLDCKHHSVTLESSRGVIKQIVNRDEHVHDWTCTVRITAKVDKEEIKHDANFDVNAKLNKNVFESGEQIIFTANSNADGFLTIFHYYPSTNTLTKLFPNSYTPNNKVAKDEILTIPSSEYRLKVSLSDGQHSSEYIYFVYTERPINFLNKYELQDFSKAWDSISTKKRLVKKGFVITKGEI